MEIFRDRLDEIIGSENVIEKEPLSAHTTFRVGGPADYYVYASSETVLINLLTFLKEHNSPYYIIGNGSNLLVSDKGYNGVVIQLTGEFELLHTSGTGLVAGSGVLLGRVAREACNEGLAGLEFAAGIPGTVGGAMVMNAGAYGGEMKDIVESVRILWTDTMTVEAVSCEDMQFGYRHSILKERGGIVLAVKYKLEEGNTEEIGMRMKELNDKRRDKQPLEYPSAGSTFKRPEGYYAAALIEDCNLKGYSVGMAEVSTKHAGFIVNKGGAGAGEIKKLIDEVIDRVYKASGVRLEPEVIMLGDFETT